MNLLAIKMFNERFCSHTSTARLFQEKNTPASNQRKYGGTELAVEE